MLAPLAVLLMTATAPAQDALTYEAVRQVEHGVQSPSVTFKPAVSGELDVLVECGGGEWTWKGALSPGVPVPVEMKGIQRGAHTCHVEVELRTGANETGAMAFDFEVASLDRVGLAASSADLDLDTDRLVVHATRAVTGAFLEVKGIGGAVIASANADLGDPTAPVFRWDDGGQEVIQLVVQAQDEHGFRSTLTLSPWSYAIPHEDVVFESGRHDIREEEAPKLESSWTELAAVLAKYGSVVEARLFVAGYTDTVGDPASNQVLSTRRAKAIATWFRTRGFTGTIAYQGFGESVLAVGTPDETDEAANRRSLYVVAADLPAISEQLPAQAWSEL